MLILVDPHSGVPVYRQIVEQVRFLIAGGVLAPGTELPSTRELSQQLGINPMTVSKAYGLLEQEEVVERRPGLRLVVSDVPREAMDRERLHHLRAALGAAVAASRQLGIHTSKAVALFRQMLDDGGRDE